MTGFLYDTDLRQERNNIRDDTYTYKENSCFQGYKFFHFCFFQVYISRKRPVLHKEKFPLNEIQADVVQGLST